MKDLKLQDYVLILFAAGMLVMGGCSFLGKILGNTPKITGSNTILSTNTITIP